jgi:hypothetical protein
MNRKRIFALLPLSLGIVGLFFGREMASWRPVKVARFASNSSGPEELSASSHSVLQTTNAHASNTKATGIVFDTRNGKSQSFSFGEEDSMGVQNNFLWRARSYGSPSTRISLEVVDEKGGRKTFTCDSPFVPFSNGSLRILPEQNRVVVYGAMDFYIWNLRNQKLESDVEVDTPTKEDGTGSCALSRDGQTFLWADKTGFRINNTSTGKITHTLPLQSIHFYENVGLSPYGRYAFFDQPAKTVQWEVVDTQTGKHLWGFNLPHFRLLPLWAVSDDEKTIVIPTDTIWQVRDLQSGAVFAPFAARARRFIRRLVARWENALFFGERRFVSPTSALKRPRFDLTPSTFSGIIISVYATVSSSRGWVGLACAFCFVLRGARGETGATGSMESRR